jgi:adenylate cyclase class 2
MAKEIEIKLRIVDRKQFRDALTRLAARSVGADGGRVHQRNVVFDTKGNDLKRRGQLLRIRTEAPCRGTPRSTTNAQSKTVLTFKRPARGSDSEIRNGKHKIREELELRVADGATLTQIIEALGMKARFRYEKFRTTYRLPDSARWAKGLLIELDETPIGVYAELEGPGNAIDRAATALGFSKNDYILTNYLQLFAEECSKRGIPVEDMTFANAGKDSGRNRASGPGPAPRAR